MATRHSRMNTAWLWPFEARRLVVVRALRVSALALALTLVLRVLVGASLGLTDDEAAFWTLARQWRVDYAGQPPLAFWLAHVSLSIFGEKSALALRMPAIVSTTIASLVLLRLVRRMGWSKGAHATAIVWAAIPFAFFSGVLAGPIMPVAALWLGILACSFELGIAPKSTSLWRWLGFLSALSMLAGPLAMVAPLTAAAWILSTPQGRAGARANLPTVGGIAIAIGASVVYFWPRAATPSATGRAYEYLVFWISQFVLYGPVLIYVWTRLARHPRHARFLSTWALVPALVFFTAPLYRAIDWQWAFFVYVPALAYFARLATDDERSRVVRWGISTSAWLTVVGIIVLYVRDPGWSKFEAHFSQLPTTETSLPLVTATPAIAAQARHALDDARDIRWIDSNRTDALPSRFLYLDEKTSVASLVPATHQCDEYSSIGSLALALCRKSLNAPLDRVPAAAPRSD